jgi:hypothetical protein
VSASYDLDTTALPPGAYTLVCPMPLVSGAGVAARVEIECSVYVLAVP